MADCHPERIFEELSCSVAKEYVGGKAVRFGWPRARSVMPGGFGKAIAELCRRIGEGDGYLGTYSTGDEKDGGLDVVAWRPIDEMPGKLLLFGACATGRNWETKLTELQPQDFCGRHIDGNVSPTPAKAFFTPWTVPRDRWRAYSGIAGVIFDRCRVSKFVPRLPDGNQHGDVREWMRQVIEQKRPQADH